MKKIIFIVLSLMVVEVFGQGLSRPGLLGGSLRARRIQRSQEASEQLFRERYPSGTNEFNRTFEQQSEYEKSFELSDFLGFEFGSKYEGRTEVKLIKPFRGMVDVELGLTVKGRIARVGVSRKTVDISNASLSNEVDKIVSLLSRHYKVSFSVNSPSWYLGSNEDKWFFNEHIAFRVSKRYDAQRGTGEVRVMAEKGALFKDDEEAMAAEKAREIEKKCKKYDIPADEGEELLSSPTLLVQSPETQCAQEAARRAQAEQERAQREAERTEQRQQLLAIQEELRRVRLAKAKSGDIGGLVKELGESKELAQRSKIRYEQLLGMAEDAKKLTSAARKLYEEDLAVSKARMESDAQRVADIQAMLTPEKIEAEKRRQEEAAKAKAEYEALRKKFVR